MSPSVRLVCVVPCFNEASSLSDVLSRIPRTVEGAAAVDVVLIDDGSTDGSAEAAERHGVTVVRHTANLGVGAAFQTGVDYALTHGADVMVWMDGDGQFDPADIPELIAPVLAGRAGMATASRFLDPALISPEMPRVKRFGNRVMSRLISALVGARYHDVSCGFRAFSRDALLRLNLYGRFTYTQETFLNLFYHNVPIQEVPLRIAYFKGRRSRVANNLPAYAARALVIILSCYRDYFPMKFYSAFSALFVTAGAALIGYMLSYDLTGQPPFVAIWAGVAGAVFMVTGAALLATAFTAHLLARLRHNQERALYLLKRSALGAGGGGAERDRIDEPQPQDRVVELPRARRGRP